MFITVNILSNDIICKLFMYCVPLYTLCVSHILILYLHLSITCMCRCRIWNNTIKQLTHNMMCSTYYLHNIVICNIPLKKYKYCLKNSIMFWECLTKSWKIAYPTYIEMTSSNWKKTRQRYWTTCPGLLGSARVAITDNRENLI